MVSKRDVGYEYEMLENISASELREQHKDGILVWLNSSGHTAQGGAGFYRCVLDVKGNAVYMDGDVPDATTNQAMIRGAVQAVSHIEESNRIFLVAPVKLGFLNAFRGKGVNSSILQELLEIVKQKKCQLTEVHFVGGFDEIKRFMSICAQDKNGFEEKKDYKQLIYEDCLKRVTTILERNNVAKRIIHEVNELRPWIRDELEIKDDIESSRVREKKIARKPIKTPEKDTEEVKRQKEVEPEKKVAKTKQEYELDGEIYFYKNGKWLDSKFMSVPSSKVSQLNQLLARNEDFSDKSIEELISLTDDAKMSDNTQLAIKAAEEAIRRADLSGIRLLLPRLSSLYRLSGRPQKAIDLYETYHLRYDKSVYSPALFTSIAAAYCDLELIETARKYANRAKAILAGESSSELISVYARIKSME